MNVSEIAQALEEPLAGFLHGLPAGVGVNRHQAVGQGTAAAQRYAEIVNGIRTEIGGNVVALLRDPQHPVAEAGRLQDPS